ncbi:MAG TPA: LCP family protein [Candidatus Dormibacteraeota bacterium]|jgi:LCP family protein required for cell wall assembly
MARLKARRSRYRFTHRLAGTAPAAILVVLLLLTIGGTTYLASRVLAFVNHVTGGGVSIATITQAAGITEPPLGSIAYRLKHKEAVPINILVLGYGGQENDAPYLTDSLMAIRLDPATGRIAMISIPRDLYVSIPAWAAASHISDHEKINAAFEYGTDESQAVQNSLKKPDYRGRDGGGHLAEDTVANVTGLHFDRYAAVDFKAFRQMVDALGGVDVCLDGPLDDYSYPDYHSGYVRGGIHFPAGCQHINGEQALRLSRSRDAVQPAQASDFGRARRQQQVIAAIKKQALSADGLSKGLPLMAALNDNFRTDLTVDDIAAIYNWSKGIDENSILHYALTNTNLLTTGGCGAASAGYILCPDDPSFQMIHDWVGQTFPAPLVIGGHAPVQVAWGGYPSDVADGVTDLLKPYGFQVANPIHPKATQTTVIYDFSGGAYPDTSQFLAQFFKATVVTPTTATPAPSYIPANQGFVVYLGHDYGIRWFNLAHG